MNPRPGSIRRLRLLTAVTVGSVWLLVIVGGIVRVTESGLGCPDWPLCTPSALPLPNTESVIEYSHRVVVAWVTLLVAAVVVTAWRTARARRDILWPACIALALLPLQAVLGWAAIEFDLAGEMVSYHFMLGMTFLAVNAITAAAAWRPVGADGSPRPVGPMSVAFLWWARAGALVGLATVSLGTAVMANGAAMACGRDWPLCNGGFAEGGGLAALQVTHRMLAYTLAVVAVVLAVLAARGHGPRPLGMIPAMVVTVQIGFGVWIVVAGENYAVYASASGAHVAGAGFLWGTLVLLAAVCESSRRSAARSAPPVPAGAAARLLHCRPVAAVFAGASWSEVLSAEPGAS
jgi:heme A synthase